MNKTPTRFSIFSLRNSFFTHILCSSRSLAFLQQFGAVFTLLSQSQRTDKKRAPGSRKGERVCCSSQFDVLRPLFQKRPDPRLCMPQLGNSWCRPVRGRKKTFITKTGHRSFFRRTEHGERLVPQVATGPGQRTIEISCYRGLSFTARHPFDKAPGPLRIARRYRDGKHVPLKQRPTTLLAP